jgi:hypothetical protein
MDDDSKSLTENDFYNFPNTLKEAIDLIRARVPESNGIDISWANLENTAINSANRQFRSELDKLLEKYLQKYLFVLFSLEKIQSRIDSTTITLSNHDKDYIIEFEYRCLIILIGDILNLEINNYIESNDIVDFLPPDGLLFLLNNHYYITPNIEGKAGINIGFACNYVRHSREWKFIKQLPPLMAIQNLNYLASECDKTDFEYRAMFIDSDLESKLKEGQAAKSIVQAMGWDDPVFLFTQISIHFLYLKEVGFDNWLKTWSVDRKESKKMLKAY